MLHNTYMNNNDSDAQIDTEKAEDMKEHNNNVVAYLTDQSHPADVRNILSSSENMNGEHKRQHKQDKSIPKRKINSTIT